MLTFKLTKVLTDPDSPAWEALSLLTLGPSVHSNRKMGFLLARDALRLALKQQKILANISDLHVIHHHSLAQWPNITLSLSHSCEGGAAVIADKKDYLGVGIDIEKTGRTVKDPIIERISHPQDQAFSNLELWCIKEAAFKCIMNAKRLETPIEFSSIRLHEKGWEQLSLNLQGQWQVRFEQNHLVALAWITTSP